MTKVIIYIRVSTKLQEDRFSLSAQREELRRYAASQDWEIVSELQDVESGGKLDKQGLNTLLDAVEEGRTDIVLVIDQDRLSRLDTVEWEYLKGVLRDNKVKIAEPGSITDLTNEDDEFISDIKNLIAKREKRSIVRRMMRGKKQKLREGYGWGSAPFEYRHNSDTGKYEIREEWAWVIPLIDDLYLNDQLGARPIARRLTDISKTPTGKEWTEELVRTRLSSKFYHGVIEKTFASGEVITVENAHESLRTEKTFEKIQEERQRRKTQYKLRENPNTKVHLLRRTKIRCGICGNSLVLTQKGTKQKPRFYLEHHKRERPVHCSEYNKSFNAARVESGVMTALQVFLAGDEVLREYFDLDNTEKEMKQLKIYMRNTEKALLKLQTKLDRLVDLYLDGDLPKEELSKRRKSIDNEIEHLTSTAESYNKKYDLFQKQELNMEYVYEFLSAMKFLDKELTSVDKVKIMGRLFPKATLYPDRMILHLDINGISLDIPVPALPAKKPRGKKPGPRRL